MRNFFLLCGVIGLLGLHNSVYRIPDTEGGMLLRANKLLLDEAGKAQLQQSGVHFKIPFLDRIIRWDTRMQHMTLQSIPLMTAEDIAIRIDYRVSWRVKEPTQYIEWMIKTPFEPKSLFLRWLNEYLQMHWQLIPLYDLINNKFEPLKIHFEEQTKKMGMEIIDCKIIQKMPTPHFKRSILSRMGQDQIDIVSEHTQHATMRAATIQADAKRQQAILLGNAQEKAEHIKNEGETAAMQLYIEAYSKNQKFAQFYQQLMGEMRSLESSKSKLMTVQMHQSSSE
jgi:membrane protease subunit HflC